MDPATAFSVACGVIQILQFGMSTAKTVHEIYKNRSALDSKTASLDNETSRLRGATSTLTTHLENIKAVEHELSKDQKELQSVAYQFQDLSYDLLDRIDALKISGSKRKRDLPLQWARIAREKDKIEKTRSRLQRLEHVLNTQMLVNLSRQVDTTNAQQRRILCELDLKAIQDSSVFKSLQKDFQAVANNVNDESKGQAEETRRTIQDLNMDAKHQAHVDHVLQILSFETMYSRQEAIREAYPETYKWIFDDTVGPWNSFVKWLESDCDLYWVNGKAGSGKSTNNAPRGSADYEELMSYIIEHPSLEKHVKIWTQNQKMILLKFLFWRAGSREQKSLGGLIRSLTHQLISAYRQYDVQVPMTAIEAPIWSERRLLKTLKALLDQKPRYISILMFIDGIDEFDGDEDSKDDLLAMIKDVTWPADIKAVISSRPEPFLTENFSKYNSLRLQDLTRSDLSVYAKGKLLNETRMKSIQESCPERTEDLLAKIATYSDGVFLWLRLAVQDLIGGIRARDTIDMLENRLNGLNRSLEGLFSQLMDRIHPEYQTWAANYMKFLSCWRLAFQETQPTLLHLIFNCHHDFESAMQSIFDTEGLKDSKLSFRVNFIEDIRVSLLVRTGGLLEIQEQGCSSLSNRACGSRAMCSKLKDVIPVPDTPLALLASACIHFHLHSSIQFIHRSALDFLSETEKGRSFMSRATITGNDNLYAYLSASQNTMKSVLFFLREPWYIKFAYTDFFERDRLDQSIYNDFRGVIHISRMSPEFNNQAFSRGYFRSIGFWLTKNNQKVLSSIKLAKLDRDDFFRIWSRSMTYANHIDPEDVLTIFSIGTCHVEFASNRIDEKHTDLVDDFFVCFVSAANSRQFLLQFFRQLQVHVWESQQLAAYRKFVKKLFEMGLNANAKHISRRLCTPKELDVRTVSHWEQLLSKAFPHRDAYPHSHSIWRECVFAIAELFVSYGANVNAHLIVQPTYRTDSGSFQIIACASALWVVDFFDRLKRDTHQVRGAMVERGAISRFSVISISKKGYSSRVPERRVYFVDREQAGRLKGHSIGEPVIRSDWSQLLGSGLEVDTVGLRMEDIISRLWDENQDRAEEF